VVQKEGENFFPEVGVGIIGDRTIGGSIRKLAHGLLDIVCGVEDNYGGPFVCGGDNYVRIVCEVFKSRNFRGGKIGFGFEGSKERRVGNFRQEKVCENFQGVVRWQWFRFVRRRRFEFR
jgi:hypothetical protein